MIYVLLADGFEEIEAITVIDTLRRAEHTVVTVSITDSLKVKAAHDVVVMADETIDAVDLDKATAVVLPGGMPGTTRLDESEKTDRLIRNAHQKSVLLAAICAAPMVLGKRGLLKGEKAVCYPGFESYLKGADIGNEPAVLSGRIITSRGAGTAFEFAKTILIALGDRAKANELQKAMLYTY